MSELVGRRRSWVGVALRSRLVRSLVILPVLALTAGCPFGSPPESGPGTIRLVGRFAPSGVEGTPPAAAPIAPTQWRFDGVAGAGGAGGPSTSWQAGPHVERAAVRDGLLTGRATGDFPILALQRPPAADLPDQVQAIEIRVRVSAGASLGLQVHAGERADLASLQAIARRVPWLMSIPLEPGPEARTYRISPPVPVQGANLRHLLVRPTDAAGADFAIESVRIVFRREHLATIPSGVGWQGLRDVFRETLVARAPEKLRFDLDLPAQAWLDLAVGTVEEGPVTFRVRAEPVDASGAVESSDRRQAALLERTVTTAYRWEPLALDLAGLSGRRISLSLELAADSAGRVGFWGSPVVRTRRPPAPGRPRGVILIQADTLRRDHLDAYGHDRPTAPFLTSWADGGVLFRHASSQAPWTKVSTPSILASLYPTSHGVRQFADRLPSSATTVAEAFRDGGYATLSLLSVPFAGQLTNLHQGFEELHESSSLANRSGPLIAKTAREHVDRLLAWIERRGDSPFFAFLHVFDPHHPLEPYAPYDRLWVDPEVRAEHVRQRDAVTPHIANEFMKVRQLPSRAEVEAAGFDAAAYVSVESTWYDASIRAMDVELGRLVERLRAAGLEDDTLILLLSDHGTEFHEHGEMWHGHTLYGELTDVPMVARWPGRIAAGRRIDELVQTIDAVPTLLELARLPVPPGMQGQSLVPLLAAEARQAPDGSWPGWRPRPAISERVPSSANERPPRDRSIEAVVEGDWKLVHYRSAGAPADELYAWRQDPLNRTDVAAAHPEVVARLAGTLDAWRRRAEAGKPPSDAETESRMSAEELQQLRSLGYLN